MARVALYLPNGGWLDYWVGDRPAIRRFVAANRLKALDSRSVPTIATGSIAAKGTATRLLKPLTFPGGLRVPHLHLDGKVYQLSQKQWETFSARIVADARVKLATVTSVNFDNAMSLAQVAESLP